MFRRKMNVKRTKQKLRESKIRILVENMLNKNIQKTYCHNSDEYILLDSSNDVFVNIKQDSLTIYNKDKFQNIKLSLPFVEGLKKMCRTSINKDFENIKKLVYRDSLNFLETLDNNYKL